MICLKGSTDVEDVLLNIAGMLAPVIAFVPTPAPPKCTPAPPQHCAANIDNNIKALLVIGALALLGAAFLTERKGTKPAAVAWVSATLIWAGGLLVFLVSRSTFRGYGHYAAAGAFFVLISLVAVTNVSGYRQHKGSPSRVNPYVTIAIAIPVSALVIFLVWLITGWSYWVLAIEVALIIPFVAFWIVQTVELWDHGLRPELRS